MFSLELVTIPPSCFPQVYSGIALTVKEKTERSPKRISLPDEVQVFVCGGETEAECNLP